MIGRAACLVLAALSTLVAPSMGQRSPLQPLDVARVFAARYPEAPSMSYISALAWSGRLRLATLTGEGRWRQDALGDMRPFLQDETLALSEPYRLTNLAGLMAFAELGEPGATTLARRGASLLEPDDSGEVVRFATGWTDDMFMAIALAARVSDGQDRLSALVERLLTRYGERLQRDDGLFVHSESGPFAWGRGNGFAALGMAEALTYLPATWSGRERVLEMLRRQMRAMVLQQTDDGSWRQVVDHPESYRELTVTALMVTVMARGIRLGWLDAADFGPVIERGWAAISDRVGLDGTLRDVCASTPAGPTLEFYMQRPVIAGTDDRGGALVLLAALEMETLRRS